YTRTAEGGSLRLICRQPLGDLRIELGELGPQGRQTLHDLIGVVTVLTTCPACGTCPARLPRVLLSLSSKIINGSAYLGEALHGRRTHNRILAGSADSAGLFEGHRDGRLPPF